MVGGVPQSDLSTNLTTATTAAPDLKTDPGTAVAVASGGGDVGLKAQAVQQAKTHVATAEAADGEKSRGLFGDIGSDLGKIGGDIGSSIDQTVKAGKSLIGGAVNLMNVPLKTAQQEYRYLHDVEARHGRTAAIMEGLGLLAGATVGGVAAGPEGVVAGGDIAGWIEGHVAYKDSWTRAANPNYKDPHTGQLVSFGSDVSDLLGLRTGSFHNNLSDAFNAVFTLGESAPGLGVARSPYTQAGSGGLLGKVFTGTSTTTAEQVEAASSLPRVRLAFEDIARSDAGTIATRYPQLSRLALTLEGDTTAEEVKQTFMELAGSMEMMEAPTLPTMSLSHLVGRGLRDAARNAGGPLGYLPRSIADALESQPGNTLNPDSLDFMHAKVSLNTDDGAKDLYRFLRFGQGDRVARTVVDAFLHGTPGERYSILKNGVYSTLLAMAKVKIPDTDEYADLGQYMEELGRGDVTQRVMEGFQNNLQQAMADGGDKGRIYGTDELGNVIDGPVMSDGTEIAAGIVSGQEGDVALPNLVEARRMAQAIRSTKVRRVLASADDAFYNHVTQAFYKPIALLSGAYASHIALAEAIPNTLREGMVTTTKSMYARVLGKMGYDADVGDVRGLAGYLYRMGGKRLIENSDDAEALMKAYALNEGNARPIGLMAGEITAGETQPVLKAENGLKQLGAVPGYASKDWAQMGNENSKFAEIHQASFRRSAYDKWSQIGAKAYLQAARAGKSAAEGTIAAREAVEAALRDEDPSVLANFARSTGKRASAPDGWDPITDWADAIVSRMKGVVHARPTDVENKVAGPINMDLLHSMANGHVPDISAFEKMSAAERPLRVEGQLILPSGDKLMQKIYTGGFRPINAMVNAISRNQEFVVEYLKQYHALDKAVENGTISDDERVVMANYRAVSHGVRFVHNLTDRTQWTTTLRNWAPFIFAQEQAFRRMGRFLVEDPAGFRKYQLAIASVAHIANSYADGNGNQYITFPGSGFLGKGVASAMGLSGLMVGSVPAAQFGGSLSSASVIFPMSNGVAPDVGPLASIGAQGLITMFEHLGKDYSSFSKTSNVLVSALNAIDGNEGGYDQSILEQIIPNATVERAFQDYAAQQGGDRAFNSSVFQTYQLLDYMQNEATDKWVKDGSKGSPPQIIPTQQQAANDPHVLQEFTSKVKNYVTTLYAMRAVLGFFSPISAEIEPQDFGFSAKLQEAITKAGSVNQGFTDFLTKYPNAVPYTVSESFVPGVQGTASGYSLSSSVPAQNWIAEHQSLLNNPKYGNAVLWLMPQLKDEKYSATVYNEQIADGLRVKDTPTQFLDQLYYAAGNAIYYKNYAVFEKSLAAAGNDSTAKNEEYNLWNAFTTQLKQQYPVWASQFYSPNRVINATDAVTGLKAIFADGKAPPGPQSAGVEALLKSYDVASTQYAEAGRGVSYSTQQYQQAQVKDNWDNYLETTATAYPYLKPVIQSVFMQALKAQEPSG